ncbi:MAG TPA: hypothetical protein P5119_10800 [Candidatus Aminicenantes bacterium]|nr:hypothetical protein [Candidatus Aminicenantes bacterium]HRY65814.1 hypothetical protein [Candidatus Aminicenantes bacterium]HRZ72728.1 hypothetical protein [Candidatus Aminicenantes bacterium]
MSKTLRIVLIILAVDLAAVGAYFGIRALGSGGGEDPTAGIAWTTMDESYQPTGELEEFMLNDFREKELLPLQFRNFGSSSAVLKKFRGSKMAGSGVSVLEMQFKGLEAWALVEIWYKGEEGREIRRTVLYILTKNAWKVGDSGRLAD